MEKRARMGFSAGRQARVPAALVIRFAEVLNENLDRSPSSSEKASRARRDRFFRDFYVDHRRPRELIESWLERPQNHLGQVLGIQGTGKTTILARSADDVDDDVHPVIMVDVRQLIGQQP